MKESAVQTAVIAYLKARGFMAAAVPNGAVLAGDAKQRAMQMAAMKRTGLVKGFPDLVVIGSLGRAAFIEVKAEGGKLSPEQERIGQWLVGSNHKYAVVRSVEDAECALREWGWAA